MTSGVFVEHLVRGNGVNVRLFVEYGLCLVVDGSAVWYVSFLLAANSVENRRGIPVFFFSFFKQRV